MTKKKWTDEEVQFLKFAYPNKDFTTKDIITALGRSERSVITKAKRLGLKKLKEDLPSGHKRCTKCKTVHLISNFGTSGKRIHSWCKECLKKRYEPSGDEPIGDEPSGDEITKKCSRCNEIKNISEFNKYSRNKDGHYHLCRKCSREEKRKSEEKLLKERGW